MVISLLLIISMDYKKEDLEKLILEQNKSYIAISKMYGVSGAAIKKKAAKNSTFLFLDVE